MSEASGLQSVSSGLPPGTTLAADYSLRTRSNGRLLVGGSPLKIISVTTAGAAVIARWLAGSPIDPSSGAQAKLAHRLVSAGMMHPCLPSSGGATPGLTVVIPVKDDEVGLDRTLAGLRNQTVVVVDDGSRNPVSLAVASDQGPKLLRRDLAGGPGQARQTAMPFVSSELVAFVDAGVTLDDDDLGRLARWFHDPEVVAVGPRVAVQEADDDTVTAYEMSRSPLDLGPSPANVGPGGAVSYLPTACLVVRRSSFAAVGGFDPDLRFGEDVDLVWRLLDFGSVRYDPTVVAHHPARPTIMALAKQRFGYGSAAGPLAVRHGDRLAPVRMSGWSVAVWLLALAGRPGAALGLAAATALALRRKLSRALPDPGVEGALLTARGHWYAGVSLAEAAVRTWWPITAICSLTRLRRPAAALVALAWVNRAVTNRPVSTTRFLDWKLGVVDDLAYGAGVWIGALRNRALACLWPKLVNWPGKDPLPDPKT